MASWPRGCTVRPKEEWAGYYYSPGIAAWWEEKKRSFSRTPSFGHDPAATMVVVQAGAEGKGGVRVVKAQPIPRAPMRWPSYKEWVTMPLESFWSHTFGFFSARVSLVGLLGRTVRVLAVAYYVRRQYKHAEAKSKLLTTPEEKAEVWDSVHGRMAALICSYMLEFQGLWIKVGQFLSTRADIMPDPWIEELRVLQDAVPREPWSATLGTIRQEFGVRDPSERFASLDEEPLATASIASVHRATLLDGTEIVIKVQRRGVASIITSDLSNLKYLARRLAKEDAKFDFTEMLDEWAQETLHELDFIHEAHNTEVVARNLARARHATGVKVPRVVRGQGVAPTRRALCLEYIDGVKVTDAAAVLEWTTGEQLVADISAAFAQQVFVDGVFNADPHPGNLMVERGTGRTVLIDFGLTKHVPHAMRVAFARLLISAAEFDCLPIGRLEPSDEPIAPASPRLPATRPRPRAGADAGLLMAISEMGLPVSIEDPADAMDTMRYLLRDAGPVGDSARRRYSYAARRPQRPDEPLDLSAPAPDATHSEATGKRYPSKATPGSLLFLVRVVSCLRGMATTLDVQHSYLEAMRPYARQALRDALLADPATEAAARQHAPLGAYVAPQAAPSAVQDAVAAAMREAVGAGATVGVQACVFHEGRLLCNLGDGELGVTDPRAVRLDTLFCAFSCGKAVCAALLHVLCDQGYLGLDERVAALWPEYGCHGKEHTTVRMVLEHRSGLAHVLPPLDEGVVRNMTDWRYMVELLAASEPTEPVGEFRYHYLTHGWLVGAIAERAVARRRGVPLELAAPLPELLDEFIVRPLGLEGQLFCGLPPREAPEASAFAVYERLASVKASRGGDAAEGGDMFDQVADEGGAAQMALDPRVFNDPLVRRAVIPAANMHFTAHALATLYAALAADGAVGDRRILSARYAGELQRQLRRAASEANPVPAGLRIFELGGAGGAFGFVGMANSIGLAHPALGGLAVVVLVNELTLHAGATKRVLGRVCDALGYAPPAWDGLGLQDNAD